MDLIVTLEPSSVLDVGAGFGKYGVLCREYLELWDGRQKYSEFARRIDAVEAFEEYITPIHRFVYNHVYVDDISKIIDTLDFNYDLVLLIDVLEHFDKNEGVLLARKILAKHGGMIISTPKTVSNQRDAFNNEYEIHRSQWTRQELSDFGNSLFVRDDVSFICFIGKENDVRELEAELKVMKSGFKRNKNLFTGKTKKFLGSIPPIRRIYHFIKNKF